MYFISEVLSDSKTCYSQIQKLLYTVLITKRKLCHCFESHQVTVMMSFPLSEMGTRADESRYYLCHPNGHQVPGVS